MVNQQKREIYVSETVGKKMKNKKNVIQHIIAKNRAYKTRIRIKVQKQQPKQNK